MLTPLILAAQSSETAAGAAALAGGFALFTLILMILGLVLAIVWIVFPFIVIGRLGYLARTSYAIFAELRAIRDQITAAGNLPKQTQQSPPLPKPPLPSESFAPPRPTQ